MGAVADHLDDVLLAEDYRRGVYFRVLELGATAIFAAWVAVSLPALRMQKAEDGRDR